MPADASTLAPTPLTEEDSRFFNAWFAHHASLPDISNSLQISVVDLAEWASQPHIRAKFDLITAVAHARNECLMVEACHDALFRLSQLALYSKSEETSCKAATRILLSRSPNSFRLGPANTPTNSPRSAPRHLPDRAEQPPARLGERMTHQTHQTQETPQTHETQEPVSAAAPAPAEVFPPATHSQPAATPFTPRPRYIPPIPIPRGDIPPPSPRTPPHHPHQTYSPPPRAPSPGALATSAGTSNGHHPALRETG